MKAFSTLLFCVYACMCSILLLRDEFYKWQLVHAMPYAFTVTCLLPHVKYLINLIGISFTFNDNFFRISPATADQISLIDPRNTIPIDTLVISVLCEYDTPTGTHALLLFEWWDVTAKRTKRMTGELSCRKGNCQFYAGKAKGKVSGVAEGTRQGRILISQYKKPYYARFHYDIKGVGEVKKLIETNVIGEHTFSASSNQLTQSISQSFNCATWCVFTLKKFNIDLNLNLKHIETPRSIVNLAKRHQSSIQKPLIVDGLFMPGKLSVAIVCSANEKFGSHAYLFLQWVEGNERVFARIDYRTEGSNIVSGEATIANRIERGTDMGKRLLNAERNKIRYANFTVDLPHNIRDVVAMMTSDAETYIYSVSGDTSSADLNSRNGNQNCATWVAKVLEDYFQIDLRLNDKWWQVARTPNEVVIVIAPYLITPVLSAFILNLLFIYKKIKLENRKQKSLTGEF